MKKILTIVALLVLTAGFALAAKDPVNLNQADLTELDTLPGIGPALAQRIIDFREKNGPFKKLEDLMNVSGIGEKKFLQLKDLVTLGPTEGQPEAAAEQAPDKKPQ